MIATLWPLTWGLLILLTVFVASAGFLWILAIVIKATSHRPEGHSFGEDITPKH